MRELNIADYQLTKRTKEGGEVQIPYSCRESIAAILLSSQLKLNAVELLKNNAVAAAILDWKHDTYRLEDAEYDALLAAANTVRGYTQDDVELVTRIKDAPKVDVQALPGSLSAPPSP